MIANFVAIQLIVSVITLVMVIPSPEPEDGGTPDTTYGEPNSTANSIYDDNDYLVALTATCTSDNGTTITLSKDNTYERTDSESTSSIAGTYSITKGSVFDFTSTSSSKSTLFYDGFALTDGTTFYNCEATTTEKTSNE